MENPWNESHVEFPYFYIALQLTVFPLVMIINAICGNSKMRAILSQVLATAELCIINYEFIGAGTNIMSLYYILVTCTILFIWKLHWINAETYPNVVLEYMLVEKKVRGFSIFIIFAQILGDYLAFILMPIIWYYTGFKRSLSCSTIFHKSHEASAFIFEWMVTIVHRLLVYIVTKISVFLPEECVSIILSILMTICRVAGYYLAGSLNNPVFGTFLRFSCSGIHDYQSLFVYWFAPFSGSFTALFIFRLCKQLSTYFKSKSNSKTRKVNLVSEDINYGVLRKSKSLYAQQTFEHKGGWSIKVPFMPRT